MNKNTTMINILDPKIPAMRELQKVRKEHSLKQEDIGRTMGVSQARVSYLENCPAEILQLRFIDQYVRGLGGRLVVTAEFDEDDRS